MRRAYCLPRLSGRSQLWCSVVIVNAGMLCVLATQAVLHSKLHVQAPQPPDTRNSSRLRSAQREQPLFKAPVGGGNTSSSIGRPPPPVNTMFAQSTAAASARATESRANVSELVRRSPRAARSRANDRNQGLASTASRVLSSAPAKRSMKPTYDAFPEVLMEWWSSIHFHAVRLGLNTSSRGSGGGSSSWKRSCRRFGVGRRKDYQQSVKQALIDLQLCETRSAHWDVWWGDQWLELSDFFDPAIRPGALVNTIPGFRSSFGDKESYARLHESCLRRQLGQVRSRDEKRGNASRDANVLFCDWTKRGFSFFRQDGALVNGPIGDFRAHARRLARSESGDRNEYPQLWILKPQQSFNQMGITIVCAREEDLQSDATAREWVQGVLPLDGSWTRQEYVKHPLLYRGRKFDLRVWAVITSIDPLRVYLLDHAFPKISTVPYTPDAAAVGPHCLSAPMCACRHVRMPMGEGCDKENLVRPYPPHTDSPIFKRGLRFGPSFAGRGDYRDEWTIWERVVMPQVSRILATAILLAREAGALAQHRVVQAKSKGHYRRVLLLSPDFIVDDHGSVFAEEINTNGFLVGNDELYNAQADTLDLMRLVGADGWPKRKLYSQQAADLVNAFIAAQNFDEHDASLIKPALKELLHEEVAASPTAWKRIFPSANGDSHGALLKQGGEPGFGTDLDEVQSDFLRFRETSAIARHLLQTAPIGTMADTLVRERHGAR
jgi:hypothetical protein